MTIFETSFTNNDLEALEQLCAAAAEKSQFDPLSSMESLPTVDALRGLAESASYFAVILESDDLVGYAWVRWWDESTGPRVVLCDWYLVPAFHNLHLKVLRHLELRTSALGFGAAEAAPCVLAANASSVELSKAQAIDAAGFQHVFDQVEMEWLPQPIEMAQLPAKLVLKNAVQDDAQALIDLTNRVWQFRSYFAYPTFEKFCSWLATSDLSLFNIASDGEEIVGLVASKVTNGAAEIEDVQVDPRWQRKGVGRALTSHNLELLTRRGVHVVRLNTEGHDPAGARSLYEKLGFGGVRSYLRYRKPLVQISG